MQVTVSNEGAVTVVAPQGPIIANEMDELEKQLDSLCRQGTGRIVISMNEVPFIDSAGLELFLSHQCQLEKRGLRLKLSGLTDITQKIFDITHLL